MQDFEIICLPVLTDNYIHVLRDNTRDVTIVVDPAESRPVLDFLSTKNWALTHILITHHHSDHTGGVAALKRELKDACTVIGASIDKHRLPPLDQEVSDGETICIGSCKFDVWYLPGHTLGHIAYISKAPAIAFTGDVLFGMGCGRVFEGTMEQAYTSLRNLMTLNPKTLVYCTHEYTLKNGEFARHIVPDNDAITKRQEKVIALRRHNMPTVPLLLSEELSTNPFLLVESVDEFSMIRNERNRF